MITKPTLLLDEIKCKENINKMFSKAQFYGLDFRPHFKTHQSLEIGKWFKEKGVDKITVSSVTMAEYFAVDWNDITIAFPVNILEINKINALAEKINLNLLVESEGSIEFLSEKITSEIDVFIKIDVGYHRTGISPNEIQLIDKILQVIEGSQLINFSGFLGHAGQTYECKNKEEIRRVHKTSLEIMGKLKEKYKEQFPSLIISLGDTPSCSVAKNFTGVDEIRPGNFVFYDLTQNQIGSNDISQIAVALACPIVAVHKNRSEIIIYGGGVHLSKERLEGEEGTIFGRVVEKKKSGWGNPIPKMYVKSLSQEHGIISAPRDEIEKYKIGDYLLILPVHSCMVGNLMKDYCTLDGRMISKL
ncbi:MAG: alanine racemase [Calditrichaeota bacterium]|nr:MAG: alanine racemase [Calditrichota bacterium]